MHLPPRSTFVSDPAAASDAAAAAAAMASGRVPGYDDAGDMSDDAVWLMIPILTALSCNVRVTSLPRDIARRRILSINGAAVSPRTSKLHIYV